MVAAFQGGRGRGAGCVPRGPLACPPFVMWSHANAPVIVEPDFDQFGMNWCPRIFLVGRPTLCVDINGQQHGGSGEETVR
jgi:hypothetical protein